MLRSPLLRTVPRNGLVVANGNTNQEIANKLYGVTMEEPGVSKLISIQLN